MNSETNQGQAPSVDFNQFSQEELQTALASGNFESLTPLAEEGAAVQGDAQSSTTEVAATSASPTADTPPDPSAPEGEQSPSPEEAAPAEETQAPVEIPGFVFSVDADEETFLKEREAYFEKFELDEGAQFIYDRQNAQIEQLKAELATVATPERTESAQAVDDAFLALISRRQDPRTNRFVPNTEPLVRLLTEQYPREVPQLAEDFLSMASQRYQGLTLFQEYLKDYGDLDDQGLLNIQYMLDNNGRMPTPDYVPVGINVKNADAYWQSHNRQALSEAIDANWEIVNDFTSSPEEKAMARRNIQQIDQDLSRIQYGIDADKTSTNNRRSIESQRQNAISQAGDQAYINTSVSLIRSFTEQLAGHLDMFDGPGAQVTALAYGNLIAAALADDAWSKHAQEDLAKQGVTFNWKAGRAALDRLYNTEHLIAAYELEGGSPAALKNAQDQKLSALKEVKRLDLELMGKISKIAVGGAGKALQAKVSSAPKAPAVRPRTNQTAAGAAAGAAPAIPSVPTNTNDLAAYENMSPEELRSRIGQLKHEGAIP